MTDEQHHSKIVADAVNAQKLDTLLGNVDDLKKAVGELTKSVNRLAVIEERQATTSDSLGRAFKEIEKLDNRVATLEMAQPIQKQSSDIVQKAAALILTAVLSFAIGSTITGRRDPVVIPSQHPVPTGK